MEAVVARENMVKALYRVERNKGAPGVDEMTVGELRPYLKVQWPRIKEELLEGTYKPQPVRRVEIPKRSGGMRQLGIPTVVDRLIQQALHQVLSSLFDPGFSESSYGFRPGRSAHQAIKAARSYVRGGKRWVVDVDLDKFFDRVNHDVLMARVAREVKDKRVLVIIRRYLQTGIMVGGLTEVNRKGTPQGGPLSPLLSNIVLDELDKELERRGHTFCRYADDCNVYVGSKKAGERVMGSLTRFLERRLKLMVNQVKSAVSRPWKRVFLGYSMTFHKKSRMKVDYQAVKRFKGVVKERFRQGRGRNVSWFIREDLNSLLRGWIHYYRLIEVKGILEELDGWLRRKLRCVLWRQWKRSRTRYRKLLARRITEERSRNSSSNGRGAWWNSGASHMNEAFPKKYFDQIGLVCLLDELQRLQCAHEPPYT
jgi:group II intron reverse transcriptase/maturase